jgi:hypothetical protein
VVETVVGVRVGELIRARRVARMALSHRDRGTSGRILARGLPR